MHLLTNFLKKIVYLFTIFISLNSFSQFEFTELSYPLLKIFSSSYMDVDNDGLIDIVSSAEYVNGIVWFKNMGDSTFSEANFITHFADGVQDIRIGDCNNDGYSDIVSANLGDASIMLYLNTGSGDFDQGIAITNSFLADEIELGDIDNDGDFDVISTSNIADKLVWFENLGSGSYSSLNLISMVVTDPDEIRITDINNDNLQDLVVISFLERKVFWLNNLSNGTFSSPQLIVQEQSIINSILMYDINNDGNKDLIYGNYNCVKIKPNLGSGSFGPALTLSGLLGEPTNLKVTDVDLDGGMDIVVTDEDDLKYYKNLMNGNFSSSTTLYHNISSFFTSIELFDFNNDGKDDILTTTSLAPRVSLHIKNTTTGYLQPFHRGNEIQKIIDIKSGDINGDGLKDILVGSSDDEKIFSYLNNGQNEFPVKNVLFDGAFEQKNILVEDLDNDQDNDILVLNDMSFIYYIVLLENIGNGTFASADTACYTGNISGCYEFQLMDVDEDGDKDIVVLDSDLKWSENLGNLNFSSLQNLQSTIADITRFEFGDINNDGKLDIVGLSLSNDKIVWYQYINPGNFAAEQTLLNINNPVSFFVSDIDGDTLSDVVVSTNSLNKVQWFKNLGNNSFGSSQIITTSINTNEVYPCDLNGDGLTDILTYDGVLLGTGLYGYNLWYKNNGGTFINEGMPLASAPYVAYGYDHITDIDDDGDQDLIGGLQSGLYLLKNILNETTRAKGKIFADMNGNNLLDSIDLGLNFIQISTNPQTYFSYSDNEGDFTLDLYDTSVVYELFPETLNGWGLVTDSAFYTINVDSIFTLRDSLNFGFSPLSTFDSLRIDGTWSFPRCNDSILYTLTVRNLGTTLPTGTISLVLDSNIVFVSSTPAPDSINGETYYWSYDSLMYFNSEVIKMEVVMPSFLFMSDTLMSLANVSVVDSSGNIEFSHSTSLVHSIVCAYDPNDKFSFPEGIGQQGYISNNVDWIDYTIRFQNTGSDTALVVKINDQLDDHLDWNSVELMSHSHDVQTSITNSGLITFVFDDIFLPDSNTNFLGSQGFVKYRIKLNDNLPHGTLIQNDAEIYFDLNPPVITNNKKLTLYECGKMFDSLNISPNICKYNTINFDRDVPITELTWSLLPLGNGSGNFEWFADSSGTYQLNIQASNSFCNADTSLIFEVIEQNLTQVASNIICSGDSLLIFGVYRSSPTTYYDTLTNVFGCDSLLSWVLELDNENIIFTPLVDTVCSSMPSFELTYASPSIGVYSGNGVSNNIFSPYQVSLGYNFIFYTVTNDLCTYTDTMPVFVDGCLYIEQNDLDRFVSLYPNPGTYSFEINTGLKVELILVFSTTGEEMLRTENVHVDVSTLTDGEYIVEVITSSGIVHFKFIKMM